MRRTRRHHRAEMGESISFEDVLTVMTVLLLLRLIFMVPLVNLDKAKTIVARGDEYWNRQAEWVFSHKGDSLKIKPYKTAFGLEGKLAFLTEIEQDKTVYLEAVAPDSNLTVLRHNLADGSFIAMSVFGRGHSRSYRRGKLIWSQQESEWFPASDSVDYGSRQDSKAMEEKFRAWTRTQRGY
jgi:hypothetical protein